MDSSIDNSQGNWLTEEVPECPVCKSPHRDFLFWTHDRLYRLPGRFGEVKCRECGLVYVSPRPTIENLKAYYPDEYIPYQAPAYSASSVATEGLTARIRSGIREAVLDKLGYKKKELSLWQKAGGPVFNRLFFSHATFGWGNRFPRFTDGGSALDIGCGNGLFLSYLKHYGWKVQGVDMSPEAAKTAKECFDIDVFVGDLQEAPFPEKSFDYINLSHVLEHVPEPRATVTKVKELLKDDGTIYVEVPNYESYGRAYSNEYWFALDAPRHLYSFSPSTLRRLLGLIGFRVRRLETKVADLFAWDITLAREEKLGKISTPRPNISFMDKPRIEMLKGRARLERLVRPLSGDYICCWATRD